MPIRVVIVDDSLLMREGVASLLGLDDSVEVIASCESPDEALAAVAQHGPDLVLTDIRMPPTHTDEGLVLARTLGERHPGLGVIVLSQHVTTAHAVDLLGQGSARRGYLLKDRLHDVETLIGAVTTVAAGGSYIDPQVVEALIAARAAADSPLDELTPREREVLAAIAEGLNNQAIADRLVLTRRAVEKHASAIFLKLGLANAEDVSRRVRATLIYLAEAPN